MVEWEVTWYAYITSGLGGGIHGCAKIPWSKHDTTSTICDSQGDRRPFVMETVKADDNAKLGKGPSQPAPKFIGNLIAFILNLIGPKGLEFARYSLDYHTIRNYIYVNRMWGKQRADRHMPSYAKKLVDLYNQNGEIDKMLSNK
ncbi:7-hydroxymethyl chlorophyll a reductase, chloroplastic [Vitis vinifera]|uniref:7-hydroxymethyl chlorophyll a reductase, chloroplastic n=1 Tax=Vitis vinifera TaxID=29760 RepID=A0A438IJ42_VITVI|nr:7-hydroxymethyl chlorophyll a reductase, chloroplastic [Vitis vinifera]